MMNFDLSLRLTSLGNFIPNSKICRGKTFSLKTLHIYEPGKTQLCPIWQFAYLELLLETHTLRVYLLLLGVLSSKLELLSGKTFHSSVFLRGGSAVKFIGYFKLSIQWLGLPWHINKGWLHTGVCVQTSRHVVLSPFIFNERGF